MEGIIRHTRRHNPAVDIVVTHFVNPRILEALQAGQEPVSIAAHNGVTAHYRVPTIHLAREIAERITTKRLTWKQFGGTHPAPYGNRICVDLISQLFRASWGPNETATVSRQESPDPLDPESYERGRFIPVEAAVLPDAGWTVGVPDWPRLTGQCRSRFREVEMLSTTTTGEPLTLEFEGTSIGAYVLAGPDAGVAEVSIDNGAWRKVRLYHRFSKGLHYPRTVLFGTDLSSGEHTLRMRVTSDTDHKGSAMRILHFAVN